jgi:peptidase M28-like protein
MSKQSGRPVTAGKLLAVLGGAVLAAAMVRAQEQPDRLTLIKAGTMAAIATEVSGSQIYDDVIEMAGYERDRPREEYGAGTYREAAYLAKKAQEDGFDEVKIERFPQPQPQWDGEMAELWIEQPVRKLVTRYRDVPATLAPGSRTADVTAELIYVGRGDREADYAGKDVKGKIVLASGAAGPVHNMAVRRFGAAGVASFNNPVGKPIDRPDQIAWNNLATAAGRGAAAPAAQAAPALTTFGFNLSHRMGMELVDLLDRNPKVIAHAKVAATAYPADMQVVIAAIKGDGSMKSPEKEELVFSAHLFEGIAKQGANDDAGGPATQLEAGRAWIKLIKDGVLSRPKRTVRFMWVPEIEGTRAYLARYPDYAGRVLAAVNMDMVGADQTRNRNSLHLNTTPYSLPTFLNDVCEQFLAFVGDTNREKLHNRRIAYGFQNPILDPRGSRDPFWYHVEKFYGSSDHQVFIDAAPRVPSIQFGNWPDAVYHTSEDTPLFQDPTQFKRAAFIALTVGQVLANATSPEALAIGSLTAADAQQRIGEELAASVMSLAQAADPAALQVTYKEALNVVRWAYKRERAAVLSASTMMVGDKASQQELAAIEAALAAGQPGAERQVQTAYASRSAGFGLKPVFETKPSAEEQAAARLFPHPKAQTVPAAQAPTAPPQTPAAPAGGTPAPAPPLVGYAAMEARNFADGTRSVLDVRNAVSAEFQPVALEKVVEYFRSLETAGGWTIETR